MRSRLHELAAFTLATCVIVAWRFAQPQRAKRGRRGRFADADRSREDQSVRHALRHISAANPADRAILAEDIVQLLHLLTFQNCPNRAAPCSAARSER